MTQITFQDGKILMRDGKVGTGQGCCCNQTPCTCGNCSSYTLKIGGVCVAQGVMNPIIDAPYFDETLNP